MRGHVFSHLVLNRTQRRLGEHRGVLWDRSERPSEPKDLGEAAASDESQPCDRKGSGGQDLRHPCEDEVSFPPPPF